MSKFNTTQEKQLQDCLLEGFTEDQISALKEVAVVVSDSEYGTLLNESLGDKGTVFYDENFSSSVSEYKSYDCETLKSEFDYYGNGQIIISESGKGLVTQQ